ncbi:MAG: hypothetical protein CM15mV73_200 [Caudoviricetes sp.]|nr:MAG: hypothetical protein CM15mV73_200 [Caudoviricetes sp.]
MTNFFFKFWLSKTKQLNLVVIKIKGLNGKNETGNDFGRGAKLLAWLRFYDDNSIHSTGQKFFKTGSAVSVTQQKMKMEPF